MTMCLIQTRLVSTWEKMTAVTATQTRAEPVAKTHTGDSSTQDNEAGESRVGG